MNEEGLELEKRVHNDPDAFRQLYLLNYKRIYNYVLYTTGDIETSLDITSETFFKALRALPRYKYRGASFSSWLYRIATNEITMYYRKQGRRKAYPFSSFRGGEETASVRAGVDPGELQETKESLSALKTSNSSIPKVNR